MASASANIDPMDNSLKLTLNNIIDSYFEKDEADFNILNESNIDSLYYGIDDLHKCDVIKRNHNICIISKLQYENKEVILGTDQNFDYLNSTYVCSLKTST